jgi:hypothetical protein
MRFATTKIHAEARHMLPNRYTGRGLCLLLIVGTWMSLATTARAEAQDESAAAGATRLWAASGGVQIMYGEHGVGAGAGVHVTRAVTENVRIGGMFLAVPFTQNREGECHYNYQCFYSFYEPAPVVEVHAFPAFIVDPWVRAAVGPAIMGRADQSSNRGAAINFATNADFGITFRVWDLTLAPYAGIAYITGTNGFATVPGVQFGGEW